MKENKILDASALAMIILQEDGWKKVPMDERTITLDFAFIEVLNALWKAVTQGRIDKEDAEERCEILNELREGLIVYPSYKYFSKALKISLAENITIYDSLYIAVGINQSAILYTADFKQFNIARKYLRVKLVD